MSIANAERHYPVFTLGQRPVNGINGHLRWTDRVDGADVDHLEPAREDGALNALPVVVGQVQDATSHKI